VFSDAAARRRLNAATHPAVGLELARRILCAWLRCSPAIVVDMPLLFETGFYRLTRPRVLVVCSPEVQQRRLVARDALSAAAADSRIAAQMPLAAKRRLADVVLHNDGDGLEQLQAQVEQLARQLRRQAWLHRYLLSPVGLLAAAAAAWYRSQW
jgi:dephospho-CoA kinase